MNRFARIALLAVVAYAVVAATVGLVIAVAKTHRTAPAADVPTSSLARDLIASANHSLTDARSPYYGPGAYVAGQTCRGGADHVSCTLSVSDGRTLIGRADVDAQGGTTLTVDTAPSG